MIMTLSFKRNWTLWYDSIFYHDSYTDSRHFETWLSKIKKIYTLTSIPDFWSIYNNIAPPTEMYYNSAYYIFDSEIEEKSFGNPFLIQFPINSSENESTQNINEIWLYLVLSILGESMAFSEHINGVSIVISRKHADIMLYTTGHIDIQQVLHFIMEKTSSKEKAL